MKNDENVFELIPLLIKYKETVGIVFPIEKLKHLSTDDIIERLKYCILNNKKYDFRTSRFNDTRVKDLEDNKKLMSTNDLKNKDFPNNEINEINYFRRITFDDESK